MACGVECMVDYTWRMEVKEAWERENEKWRLEREEYRKEKMKRNMEN